MEPKCIFFPRIFDKKTSQCWTKSISESNEIANTLYIVSESIRILPRPPRAQAAAGGLYSYGSLALERDAPLDELAFTDWLTEVPRTETDLSDP